MMEEVPGLPFTSPRFGESAEDLSPHDASSYSKIVRRICIPSLHTYIPIPKGWRVFLRCNQFNQYTLSSSGGYGFAWPTGRIRLLGPANVGDFNTLGHHMRGLWPRFLDRSRLYIYTLYILLIYIVERFIVLLYTHIHMSLLVRI